MSSFSPAPSADLGAARADAHDAIQLVAAAGATLLEAHPEHHHTATVFDPSRQALVGAELPDGRRAALHLPSLTLSIGEATRALRGAPFRGAVAWLAQELGADVVFPAWELPYGPVTERPAPTATDAQLAALTHWFDASHATLSAFVPSQGTASTVRAWPHHFDIATLVTLEAHDDPEKARSVGMGMTPGDGGIAAPYLYVTPWPTPEHTLPSLPVGRWHTEGWTGAVLSGDAISSQNTVDTFLAAAFMAAADLTTR